MKRAFISSALLCLIGWGPVQAQMPADSLILQGQTQLEAAVARWDLDGLMASRAYFERLVGQTDQNAWVLYYLAYAESRIVNYYFSQEAMDDAKPFVEMGIDHLEAALAEKPACADAKALLSLLLGNKIAFSPLLGITLGPKSGRLINEAMAMEPYNPRVSLIAGQSAYYTPKMWGGGKDKAIIQLKKAVTDYAHDAPADPLAPRWGRLDAWIYLGLSHAGLKSFEEARRCYRHVLDEQPDHAWVKTVLLPDLERRAALASSE